MRNRCAASRYAIDQLERRLLLAQTVWPLLVGHNKVVEEGPDLIGNHLRVLDPANIVWTNRASTTSGGPADTDGFGGIFGTSAPRARGVVDAVILRYEQMIGSFDYPSAGQTNNVTVNMDAPGSGFGAFANLNTSLGGKPKSGSITMGAGDNDGNPNSDNGWFLDPTPFENSEFAGTITNAFAGDAQIGSPASGRGDFFTVVAAEMTHCMGLFGNALSGWSSHTSDTGIHDGVTGVGNYWVFTGPSVRHLGTSDNAGTDDFHAFIHSAEADSNIDFGGTNYIGAQDQGNAFYELSRRYLINNTFALMFKDAYGYASVNPDRYGTFYVNFNETSRQLSVRGGEGNSDDIFTVSVTPTQVIVSVNVGNDVPGTGALPGAGNLPAFVTTFATGDIGSIVMECGAGNDTVNIDSLDAAIPTTVNGDFGNDTFNVGGNDIDSNVFSAITFDGSFGADTINFNDASDSGNDTYTFTGSTFTKGFPTFSYFGCDNVNLIANNNDNTINLNAATSAAIYSINCGGGNDLVNVGNGDLTALPTTISVTGGPGGDTVVFHDESATLADTYTLSSGTFDSGRFGQLGYNTIEGMTLFTSTGGDTLNLFGSDSSLVTIAAITGNGADLIRVGSTNLDSLGASTTLNIDGQAQSDTLLVNDNANTFGDPFTITSNSIDRPFFGIINYAGVESATLNAGSAGSAFAVNSTLATTPLTLNAGDGNDVITLGAGNLDALPGAVTVNGEAGAADSIVINDSGNNFNDTYTVTYFQVMRTIFGGLEYGTVEGLTLNAEFGDNTINVHSSLAACPISVNAGDGNDAIVVAFTFANLSNIQSLLTVNGGAGSDSVTLWDDVYAGNDDYTVTSTSVARPSFGGLNYAALESLTLRASAGNNNFLVNSTAAGTPLFIQAGNTIDSLILAAATSVLSNIAATVTFDGQGSSNYVSLLDDSGSGASSYTVTSSTVSRNGFAVVVYSHIDELLLTGSNADNSVFDINSTSVLTSVSGGAGQDSFRVNGPPSAKINVYGGLPSSGIGDNLIVTGNATAVGSYTPDLATTGRGTILYNGQRIDFQELEGLDGVVAADTFASFTMITPNSADNIAINPFVIIANSNQITGSSGAVGLVPFRISNIANFTLNTGANDGATPNDTVTIASSGYVASPLGGFRYLGGAGQDSLTVQGGSLTFNTDASPDTAALTYLVNTDNTGTAAINFNATQHLAGISIGAGGSAVMAPNGNRVMVLNGGTLSVSGAGAKLDLNDNDLILDYSGASQLSAIQTLINTARNGGAWDGPGLTSTSAKNNALHNTTLGAIEASTYKSIYGNAALFDGQSIDTTAVLVKYTYYGDTDFNGRVNFDDYVRTDAGFNNHRTGWVNGDFDGNGAVNFDDYVLIDLAFNTQGSVLQH
jgi:hypothetical protein